MPDIALIMQIISILAPVFILAGIGYAWVWVGFDFPVQFVTRLTMQLAVPCLIFKGLVQSNIGPEQLRDIAFAALLTYVAVAGLLYAGLRVLGYSRRTYLAPLTFGNTGNLGLPLAFFSFGAVGLDYAVVVFAVMALLSFTIGVWVVSGGKNPSAAFKEPIVWATLAGAVFVIAGWELPEWSMNTIGLIGQMAIPLMLITLGVAISRLRPASITRAVWMAFVKLFICLSVPFGVAVVLPLPPIALAMLVLQMVTPVAVTSYMLAEKYGAESDEVAGLVVISTLLSILSIPVILAFFL